MSARVRNAGSRCLGKDLQNMRKCKKRTTTSASIVMHGYMAMTAYRIICKYMRCTISIEESGWLAKQQEDVVLMIMVKYSIF